VELIPRHSGASEALELMKQPSYLKLLGKCLTTGAGVGILARKLPPQLALPAALVAGVYIGLEMAAWMEEENAKDQPAVIDVTVVEAPVAPAVVQFGEARGRSRPVTEYVADPDGAELGDLLTEATER
jgi:hypothetical protein